MENTGMLVSLSKLDTKSFSNIRSRNRAEGSDKAKREYLDLVDSIKKHGVQQPVLVTAGADGESYTLIAGFGRVQACNQLGLTTIPVHVTTAKSLADKTAKSLIENLQRSDLHWVDTATAIATLHTELKDQVKVAKEIGKTQAWVSTMLKVASAPFFASARARYVAGEPVTSFETALEIARAEWEQDGKPHTPTTEEVVKDYIKACKKGPESEGFDPNAPEPEAAQGPTTPTPTRKPKPGKKLAVTFEQVKEQIALARKAENGAEEHKALIQALQWVTGDRKAPPFKVEG